MWVVVSNECWVVVSKAMRNYRPRTSGPRLPKMLRRRDALTNPLPCHD